MKIALKKFGTTLISRQAGKEALAAFQSTLAEIKSDETIEIDFDGVLTFSPSWGDEFLTPLLHQFGDRLVLLSNNNPSVTITLELLEKTQGKIFKRG
ncbi:MAG: DUF4325 domain-containing protein [Candidatus Andersenbacteria bacterium]|nr:DUF4325 domain-containing protein [Candidatus Andersenbacteria bacterium]